MKREMLYVSVETDKSGNIELSQYQEDSEDRDVISIIPEQVDILVRWLQDAKKETAGVPARPSAMAGD